MVNNYTSEDLELLAVTLSGLEMPGVDALNHGQANVPVDPQLASIVATLALTEAIRELSAKLEPK